MNTKSFRGALCPVTLAFWAAAITPSFSFPANSWTKATSGNWEEPFWSEGHLPSIRDNPILFTNAGWKALAIGANTTANFPGSVNPLANVTVDAPADSRNTLLLNWAGLSVPFHPDGLSIGPNGALVSHSSAIQASYFGLDGQATFADFGQSSFGSVDMGRHAPAELNLSNGWFSAGGMIMAGGAASTFNQTGGSNQIGTLTLDADGSYNFFGGYFKAINIDLFPLREGSAPQLNIAGGSLEVERQVTVGGDYGGSWAAWPGFMGLARGSFKGVDLFIRNGQANQNGGSNQLTQLAVFSSRGIYWLSGGVLSVSGIGLDGGGFSQTGGTNYATRLSLTNGGSYSLDGGTLITSNTVVENYAAPAARPRFTQTAGEHRIQGMLYLESGGVYDLRGGVLSAPRISIRAATELWLKGIVSSNNQLEINGGTVFFDGNYSLGHLLFNGTGRLDFQSGSSIVHFTGVGYPPPALDGVLYIRNWKGSAQSPGRDQLYIDGTDQYTPSRIQSMFFVDPAGYPPGTYWARRKASGEIVPLERPIITFTRDAKKKEMVLTWPDGYQLFSCDKVKGPYEPVANVTNPCTISCTDPQRFFVLRRTQ